MNTITQPTKFRKIIGRFKRSMAYTTSPSPLGRGPLTEDEFFREELDLIQISESLLFFGYDHYFMDKEETLHKISEYIENSVMQPSVKCIFSESTSAESLEQLAKQTNGIKIMRTPKEINKGYIVFGDLNLCVWNSKKLSSHPKDAAKGKIYRSLYYWDTKTFPDHFTERENKI